MNMMGGQEAGAMSAAEVPSGESAPMIFAHARVEGQLIMPFYLICDVSSSMRNDMDRLEAGLADLIADIAGYPVVNDVAMVSVITFASTARTVVPLSEPDAVTLPTFVAGGETNYSAAFREFHRAFEADRARLKADGTKVYRPIVFFLSDGLPTDSDYRQTFDSLLSYDPVTGTGNRAYPNVVAFGFRDAPEQIMRDLAYPDFGPRRGRWFHALTIQLADTFNTMFSIISATIIGSSESMATGRPRFVLPALPEDARFRFGEAGDLA